MIREQENHVSFEKWAEMTTKDIFIYEDEKPKSLSSKFYDMFDEEFDEEESSGSSSKKERNIY